MPIPDNWLQKTSAGGRVFPSFNGTEAHLAGIYPNVPKVIPDIQKLDGVNGDQTSIAAGNVDFGPAMAFLAKYTNNFFRHWVIFYPNFVDAKPDPKLPGVYHNLDAQCGEIAASVTSAGQPWRERYSPFMYNSALKKWDLWRYNDEYFAKLRLMIRTARDFGIIVQLTLLDRCGLDNVEKDHCLRWHYSPWNDQNNVNKVIHNLANGVNDFYKRDLIGEIRYRDRIADRGHWPDDRIVGPAPIIVEPISLGELQDNYIRQVVAATLEYPNVVYEIMNEPIHSPAHKDQPGKDKESIERATWANTIVGVIHSLTQGKRFIFYNDHSGLGGTPQDPFINRGQDVLNWREQKDKLTNYQYLDGVIFHGDARSVHPDKEAPWLFREDLMIQVSTDTVDGSDLDYSRETANNAFANHMIYQAETNSEAAANGIHDAVPAPTILKLTPLVGTWIKTGEEPASPVPRLFYTQKADGSLISLNPDTDHVSMQGQVTRFFAGGIQFWNEATKTVSKHKCTLLSGNQQLQLERDDGWIQKFKRYDGPLTPFFYQWERISDAPVSTVPPFFLYIYPDNTLVTRRKSDLLVNNRGRITKVTGSQISIHSDTLNNDNTWNYHFSADGGHLTLEKTDHSFTQVFRRVA